MKLYNTILVSAAFAIAAVGTAVSQQQDDSLTTIYGRTSMNECVPGDASTLQIGCSTAPASYRCSLWVPSESEICTAYSTKLTATICVNSLWYN